MASDAEASGRASGERRRAWLRHPALRLAWCLAGAFAALSLALILVAPPASPLLLASLGGTTAFLFGLTRAPAAQPRALLGGHLASAAIGIACYQTFGEATWVYALAVALALAFMLATRTLHPPAGANPLLMIASHAGWSALVQPVLLGIGVLMLAAALWSRLYPGLRRWPGDWRAPSPAAPLADAWRD